MLGSLASGTGFSDIILNILYSLPAIVIAISFHEYAHGLMAYWLGDNTAKYYGRLTVNPKAHFNLYGALCMLVFGFGWANPVPVNVRALKNPKRDSVLVSLAGPLMNFLVAIVSFVLYSVMFALSLKLENEVLIKVLGIMGNIFLISSSLNLGLMVFNLLPIPPLDGSKILFPFLPARCYKVILTLERYGFMILMLLLATGILDIPLMWLRGIVSVPVMKIGELVFKLFV